MFAKLVTALISPLGTAVLLGLVAVVLGLVARRVWLRRLGWLAGVFAVGWLWLWSTPLASEALRGWIEDQAGPRVLAEVPASEVMVVLGGGVSGPRLPRRPDPDLSAAGDRLWHAARIYHAGKAQRIILSGGEVPTGDGSEADSMRLFLLDMGVPDRVLALEGGSVNTAGNAALTAELLAEEGIDEVILVTSALHMPRARALFEGAGLAVIPAPADFEVIETPFSLLGLIPDTNALNGSSRAMKELLGRAVGRGLVRNSGHHGARSASSGHLGLRPSPGFSVYSLPRTACTRSHAPRGSVVGTLRVPAARSVRSAGGALLVTPSIVAGGAERQGRVALGIRGRRDTAERVSRVP
jgi:uncharacterized SAM-binding protein YcdF (DUF218 family)